MFNQKNERIMKLVKAGLSDEQIARKIGMPNAEGLRRVRMVTRPYDSIKGHRGKRNEDT